MRLHAFLSGLLLVAGARTASAQTFRTEDPVIRRMWDEGMNKSQAGALAQVLMDSIGPRLAGSPGFDAATDWLVRTYGEWGVPARKERYGTWKGWQMGAVHVDMIAPRVQTLNAHLLAWSAGTRRPTEGAVILPEAATRAEFDQWAATARGKYVLISPPEIMCRARQELEKNATPETIRWVDSVRAATRTDWARRLALFRGQGAPDLGSALDSAGVAGVLTSLWSGGWGATRVFAAPNRKSVAVDLSCEDYGLLSRLAAHGQSPRIRIAAESREIGTVPQFNVIAEIKGSEKPGEYVLLGAHLDSWHGATGAMDNGTGTIMMLEAMRILKAAYPNPKRTIVIGHWGAEEQGLIGSGAFAEDHPEVLEGMQASFNQDNGTWRVDVVQPYGFMRGTGNLARWLAAVPLDITKHLRLALPGEMENTGSDHSSFLCRGAPGFRLQSAYDEYRQYTWHTTLDTYDKLVLPDLRNNATLAAMLAYAASEDPERVTREQATRQGQKMTCEPVAREFRDR
ncbi:MAG: M20/M25/M40 family metallo-hydrolase [Gemmatimonadales bacterium]|nr:M20/M25/M40 family metallo-hydrolase [Gemmatimonadales bacterium]